MLRRNRMSAYWSHEMIEAAKVVDAAGYALAAWGSKPEPL
jgi:hypothetical protein